MPLHVKIKAGLLVFLGLGLLSFLVAVTVLAPWPWRVLSAALAAAEVAGILAALELYVPQVTILTPSVWRGRSGGDRVALTFDDGPGGRVTEQILDVLSARGVHATFFVLGMRVEGNEGILRRMADEGHEIGNHGLSHRKMHRMPVSAVLREIEETERLVERVSGVRTHLLRTPHGFVSPAVGRAAGSRGYRIVAWSRGVWDTDEGVTADVIAARALKNIKDGDILLLHDAHGDDTKRQQLTTAEALPLIIEGARARGLRFVTAGEIVRES
jgi:peptidoglycan/xylan/chitin deacetylase (PgdA/CDA1 family)